MLCSLAAVRFAFFTDKMPQKLFDVFLGLFFSIVIVMIENSEKPKLANQLQAILKIKPLTFIGAFAYSLYLIHAPIIQLVYLLLIKPMSLSSNSVYMIFLLLGLFFSLIISYGFYLIFERPFMLIKSLKLNRVRGKL